MNKFSKKTLGRKSFLLLFVFSFLFCALFCLIFSFLFVLLFPSLFPYADRDISDNIKSYLGCKTRTKLQTEHGQQDHDAIPYDCNVSYSLTETYKVCFIHFLYTFKVFQRCFEDVLGMLWRCFKDVLALLYYMFTTS